MARMQGITGKLSGKMGAAVFRVRNGAQVVTQYNPIVKNPNTAGQRSQRARFKLISQLSAVMAPALGSFIIKVRKEGGRPTQRNAFTQVNMPLVEVASDNQDVKATIPMENVKLTTSFRYLPAIAVTDSNGAIRAQFSETIPTDIAMVRLVTVGYAGNVASIIDMRDVPRSTIEAASVTIPTPPGGYTVLAYGLIPSESAKATIDLDNIHTPADEDFVSAVELNAMVADGSMAVTKTVGANVTVSA